MVETRIVCIVTYANGMKERRIITNAEMQHLQYNAPANVSCMQFYAYGSKLARRYPNGSC